MTAAVLRGGPGRTTTPTRINAVVLLTDGKNDDGNRERRPATAPAAAAPRCGGAAEGEGAKPVRIFPIAYGKRRRPRHAAHDRRGHQRRRLRRQRPDDHHQGLHRRRQQLLMSHCPSRRRLAAERAGSAIRDRFFTPPVARAVTSPLGILAAGVGAAVGHRRPRPASARWPAWLAYGVPGGGRHPPTGKGERIDPFALSEPWRQFVQHAMQARTRFAGALRTMQAGPAPRPPGRDRRSARRGGGGVLAGRPARPAPGHRPRARSTTARLAASAGSARGPGRRTATGGHHQARTAERPAGPARHRPAHGRGARRHPRPPPAARCPLGRDGDPRHRAVGAGRHAGRPRRPRRRRRRAWSARWRRCVRRLDEDGPTAGLPRSQRHRRAAGGGSDLRQSPPGSAPGSDPRSGVDEPMRCRFRGRTARPVERARRARHRAEPHHRPGPGVRHHLALGTTAARRELQPRQQHARTWSTSCCSAASCRPRSCRCSSSCSRPTTTRAPRRW